MERSFRPFHTGSDADLAFAVMVLASYFTTFSMLQTATSFELLLMISLGVAYITLGIYGYAYAMRSGKIGIHLVYFTVQLILGSLIVYLGRGVGFNAMVLLPLSGHSVVLLPRNWRLVVNIAILLTYAVTLEVISGDPGMVWSSIPVFLAGQIFILAFTQMAVSEEKARSKVEQLVSELEEANQNLREYAVKIEELAIARERNRMAREIHDGLGHYLTTVHMQIQAARAVMASDPHRAQDALSRAQNMAQEALVDVRRSVSALRDQPGDGISLQEEIEKMLERCQNAGIQPNLKVLGGPRTLPPQSLLTIFRAVQEGINNTLKHARAAHLSVTLDYSRGDEVRLVIQDDGAGAVKTDGGFGLLGIRERVHLLNGSMEVQTSAGNGFRLEVCVPG